MTGPCSTTRAQRLIDEFEERQAAPVPVPVSERPWEREGWCDKRGRCWCLSTLDGLPHRWWLVRPEPLSHGFVLPAHALPTPEATDD